MTKITDLPVTFSEDEASLDLPVSLVAFEALLEGESLPADYREFLLSSGRTINLGPNSIQASRPSPTAIERTAVEYLYGLSSDSYSLFQAFKTYAVRLPPGVLAIGDAGGGNQVCLCLASADRSGVYHWDHEGEVDRHGHPTPDYSNMTLLASSFSDLISRLAPLPEEPSAPSGAVKVNLRF